MCSDDGVKHSELLGFLNFVPLPVFRIPDDGQSPKNLIILSVTQLFGFYNLISNLGYKLYFTVCLDEGYIPLLN
jgi:hypothetical protein